MREFLNNLFVGVLGAAFTLLFIAYLFTDTNAVDLRIIQWKASVFGAP